MPYQSKAQQGYFHAHKKELEAKGVNIAEWDKASKGKRLPQHKSPVKKALAMEKKIHKSMKIK